MDNLDFNIEKYLASGTKSIKDYILLVRTHLKSLILISLTILILTAAYAFIKKDLFVSTVSIKIVEQTQNVLENTPDYSNTTYLDRFIANEIGVIENIETREKVAIALIDSFNSINKPILFDVVKADEDSVKSGHKTVESLVAVLKSSVKAEQVGGTDVIEISAESHSPFEAALIANTYAQVYQRINLEINRSKLTSIRKFLEEQTQDKLAELRTAEDSLTKFQEKGRIVSLDVQTTGIIDQLSQLDAQKEATRIELATSNEVLRQYKYFLNKQDPQLVNYLQSQTSQAYINALQQQLAELQVNRDLALSINTTNVDISNKIKDYDQRINDLTLKLKNTINGIKANAFSSNPEQVRDLTQKLIEEEIKNNTLSVRLNQLQSVINKYEGNLKTLPKTTTELTQFQRKRESIQKIYSIVFDKYQEAVINELSQAGNAFIIGYGRIPEIPEKPNRTLIIFFGLLLGPIIGFGYILVKDYFDDTIKTPDDIEKNNVNFLSWVPYSKYNNNNNHDNEELLSLYNSDSPIAESFRAIKARISQTKTNGEFPKIILVTSPAENEGKTFVSLNLAGNFANAGKKTLLIDCDLRRPRVHSIMGVDKKPGISDFLKNSAKFEDIIRPTRTINLSFITAGRIQSNTAEMLESKIMLHFLKYIRDFFDVIVIDSAPIVAVIDTEILAKYVDGTILVVSADKTENQLMMDAVDLIKKGNIPFLGTVLNNFRYKSGYGYYFKYYYNYNSSDGKWKKKTKSK